MPLLSREAIEARLFRPESFRLAGDEVGLLLYDPSLEEALAEPPPPELASGADRFGVLSLGAAGRGLIRVGQRVFPAVFAAGQSREDRISAVHLRALPARGGRPQRARAWREGGARSLPRRRARAALSPETVEELLRDLEG